MTDWTSRDRRPDDTTPLGPPPYGGEYGQPPYGGEYGAPQAPPGGGYGQGPGYGQGRPEYGQPPYRQPGYPPPGPGRPANPFGPESNETFGITGAVLGLLGGVALVVAFTAVQWLGGSFGDLGFGRVGRYVSATNSTGFATAYYGWLAWAFLIIGVACAVASSFPNPALRVLRIIGVVVGFAAAGLSFLALDLNHAFGYLHFLASARIGFYLAVVGFVLVGIGAAYGPSREIRRA